MTYACGQTHFICCNFKDARPVAQPVLKRCIEQFHMKFVQKVMQHNQQPLNMFIAHTIITVKFKCLVDPQLLKKK